MTERRKLKSFLLHHGYVEEQSLAALPLHHRVGFNHPLDALEHLQKVLVACWKMRNPPMGCCEKAEDAWTFCPICGRRVPHKDAREDTELHGAADLFRELFTFVNDGTHDLWEIFDANGWQMGGIDEPEWLTTMVGVDNWLEEEGGWSEAYMPDKKDWNSRQDREGNPAW